MYVHTYCYQKWDKNCTFNQQWEVNVIFLMLSIILSNDFFTVLAKKKSITSKYEQNDIIRYDVICPIILFLLQSFSFSFITVSGYKRTFVLVKYILLVMNAIKIIFTFHKGKFIADLIKLVDTVWIINLLLIILTDPLVNTPQRKNLIIFYEVYFRYLEYHILMLAFLLIHNLHNTEIETEQKLYTTSAIVGKKDSYRVIMILIFAHFYFPLVNGIAYSLKYWIGFTGIIPSFLCVQSLRHNKLYKVYVYFILTVFWNISTYVIALYFSVPNAGDGHIEEANEIIDK